MNLLEHHKQFVVRGYARFMNLTQIIDEFLHVFPDDIEALCGIPYVDEEQFLEEYVAKEKKRALKNGTSEYDNYNDALYDAQVEYDEKIEPQIEEIRKILTSRFRRLDISHKRFPRKYRALFDQVQRQHFQSLHTKNLENPQNAIEELETLYNFIREDIFEHKDLTQVPLAHQILRSIVTSKNLLERKGALDVEPQPETLQQENLNLLND